MKTIHLILLMTCLCSLPRASAQETSAEAKPSQPEQKAPVDFNFDGGSLRSFISHVEKLFGADLEQIGDVPRTMLNIRIPKLRMRANLYHEVLEMYNQISSETPESGLGKWIIKPAYSNGKPDFSRPPNVLLLVDTRPKDDMDIAVKAFPFKPASKDILAKLQGVIEQENEYLLARYATSAHDQGLHQLSSINGNVRYHEGAGILVATGSRLYTDLVSEIMNAFQETESKEHKEVFVLGTVNKPGPISLSDSQRLTISDALARAGGFTARSNPNKIKFKRTGEPEQIFSLNELKSQTNSSQIIFLKPGDTIVVDDKVF